MNNPTTTTNIANNVVNNVTDTTKKVTSNISGFFQNMGTYFSNKGVSGASADYLQSNSIIAKLSFILLILIVFVVIYTFVITAIFFAIDNKTSPYLIKGILDGNDATTKEQNIISKNAVYLFRSNNAPSGAEFSWSVWLYINDTNKNKYSHVFNKGNSTWTGLLDKNDPTNSITDTVGIANVNNSPGMYLKQDLTNNWMTMRIVMDQYTDVTSKTPPYTFIDVENIPLKKWFHVCIRLQNIIVDVYVNGVLSKRVLLKGAPRQNYNNVYICQNGGFNGKLADLRYFSYALNVFDINTLVWNGFNRSMYNRGSQDDQVVLSNQWYTNKN